MGDKTDKNDPGRFLGEGVSFRAKLIGVLEVPEARGDRMCQEALADLKMAIRAAGEHKQRIQVHVAIDGLRLRDDKTGDSLYHHPVHKISFIAQDMTDSRAFGYIFGSPDTGHRFFGIKTDKAASQVSAFGYIFGSPDTGHRFFGIKTDKAASQVVIAMRDLFQVVFELKKKEIEMAKQQLEAEKIAIVLHKHLMPHAMTERFHGLMKSVQVSAASKNKEAGAEGGVAELVDLEQELSSLRRGLTQVEELTPSTDPFGDSFIAPTSKTQKSLLPPPPSGSSTRGRNTPAAPRTVFSPNKQPSALPLSFDLAASSADFESPPTSLVDNISVPSEPAVCQTVAPSTQSLGYDVFTELDPLGTGKSKPYVDKKLFFQELKNPPKKVLKDLAQSLNTETEKDHYGPATTMTSLTRHSGGSVAIAKPQPQHGGVFRMGFFPSDPFAETDPFDNTDPFSDSFNDDPFTSIRIPELPLPEDLKDIGLKVAMVRESDKPLEDGKKAFNGPLQVSLPPEPAPKSPRLQRQNTDSGGGGTRRGRGGENGSPPPPLPPKKCVDISIARPPPRPPLDHDPDSDPAPPLPRPARKREPMADRSVKPRLSSVATNSSEDEYLTPAPPPLPAARRFDITLSQLLTCSMDDLANRLRVPAATLSSMTLPQLTEYLRSYLAADNERAHIHIEPTHEKSKHIPSISTIRPASPPSTDRQKPTAHPPKLSIPSEFKPQFEDNFTPPLESSDSFVANFDDFDKKANSSYDRYAAFREIQEQELKAMSILDPPDEPKQDSDEKEELAAINILRAHFDDVEAKETSKSPLKSLDELTIDSINMFRSSVSPKPSHTPIDAKIEDIKSVMKNLQIEKSRRSVSPRDNGHVEAKQEDNNDRYAALREITITEPPDEFESLPPEVPKERKKSDEKSDGFDNSDFFDCIDNSSLSFTHVEDAFRKSPVVKEKDDKIEEKKEIQVELTPVRELQPPPTRLSTGSISDVVSGSSPETKDKVKVVGGGVVVGVVGGVGAGGRWAVLGGAGGSGASSDSRDSEPRPRARRARNISPSRRHHCTEHNISVQTSSSSRDVSPWDEDLPPVTRLPRPPSHHRDRDRESRHNSSGSRECLDSGSGREKDKVRDKRDLRDRDLSRDSRESGRDRRDSGRDSRESGRDRRDSGSGRDRRDSTEREHRDHRRDRRSRERETDTWERDRTYSRDYRDSRSRERQKEYREKDRDRHRKPRHSYDEEEDYSDGCGSGRSSSRDRWPDQRWRRDERNYGSLGWRETRRRAETRQRDTTEEPRTYSTSLGWSSRRSARAEREPREEREPRRRPRRDEPRPRDYRFSNDFSPRDHASHFDTDEPPGGKKATRSYPAIPDCPRFTMYGAGVPPGGLGSVLHQMVNSRFAFDAEETPLPSTASPMSGSSLRARDGESPATRFRFDSDSISPRSMFEDDFTTITTPRGRTVSIAEEEECDVPPLRPKPPQQHRDIKKSESINIFTRESDPFEGDAFFACTGSDRAARRENWPGDFQGFDNT